MVSFYSKYETFSLQGEDEYRKWIFQTVNDEGKRVGEIQYIFCSDDCLLDINKRFLDHDYYTDIVTFPLSESDQVISGEIYISVDRVRENAANNSVDFGTELARVIIHGILHLIGYDDQTEEEKRVMRSKEDYYLTLKEN